MMLVHAADPIDAAGQGQLALAPQQQSGSGLEQLQLPNQHWPELLSETLIPSYKRKTLSAV